MPDRDVVLLETVKTHRARLVSAFVFGELTERRLVNNNVKRLIGGVIVAAILCAVCGGFSFVTSHLGRQADQERVQQGMGPATGPVLAADAFDRDEPRGWGESDRGGRWTVAGAPEAYRVTSGAAVINSSDRPRGGHLAAVQHDRTDVTTTVRPTSVLTDGSLTVIVDGRRVSAEQGYHTVVQLTPGGGIAVSLVRTSTSQLQGERQRQISTTVTMPGSDDQGDEPTPVAIRTQVLGTNPTTIRAKAWPASGAEPKEWTVLGSDSTPDLQRPGSVGVRCSASADEGHAIDLAVDDLVVREAP
ncbi:hypothetical protein ACQBAR_11525 [Propionibacteriaceae bacterium Y1685]